MICWKSYKQNLMNEVETLNKAINAFFSFSCIYKFTCTFDFELRFVFVSNAIPSDIQLYFEDSSCNSLLRLRLTIGFFLSRHLLVKKVQSNSLTIIAFGRIETKPQHLAFQLLIFLSALLLLCIQFKIDNVISKNDVCLFGH